MSPRDPRKPPGGDPAIDDGSALGKMELRKVRAGPAPGTYDFEALEATPAVEEEFLREDTLRGTGGGGTSKALIAAAETAFISLEKALKMSIFYEARGANYERVRQESERFMMMMLDQHGSVDLEVTPFQLLVDGEPVYSSEEDKKGLSFALFRDGLRQLTLLPGLTSEEFEGLLRIFLATSGLEGEDNTVTLLWDLDLPHLRYRAADMFTEGVMSAAVGQLGKGETRNILEKLVKDMSAPLVLPGSAARIKRPGADSLSVVKAQRERRIKDLARVAEPERARELASALEGDREDTWQRTITLLARLGTADDDREQLASALAGMLEELMRGGRGESLRAACMSMAPHLGFPARLKDPDAPIPPTGAIFQQALEQLSAPEKVGLLESLLQDGQAARVEQAAALILLLPNTANPALVPLATAMSPSPPREKLISMLERRGADLSELHAIRLSSGSQDEALGAVKRLAPLSKSKGARKALLQAARHPSTRVRLEALRALGDEVDDVVASVLLDNITTGLVELQELAFRRLEAMPRCNQGPMLLRILKKQSVEKWNPKARRRALELMVRWGGSGVDPYMIEGLTMGNLLRRRAIEERREELMQVLRSVGGIRAREVCRKAIDSNPPRGVKGTLEELKEQLSQKAAAPNQGAAK